jgi:hypothetical protein
MEIELITEQKTATMLDIGKHYRIIKDLELFGISGFSDPIVHITGKDIEQLGSKWYLNQNNPIVTNFCERISHESYPNLDYLEDVYYGKIITRGWLNNFEIKVPVLIHVSEIDPRPIEVY